MADTGQNLSDKKVGQNPPVRWGHWLRDKAASATLIILVFVMGLLSILFLSAIIAQTRLSSIAIDGTNLSILKLSYIGQQWAETRKQKEAKLQTKLKLENDRDEFSATVVLANDGWRQAWSEMGPLLDVLAQRVVTTHPDLVLGDASRATEYIVKILAKRSELVEKYPDLNDLIESIEKGSTRYKEANEKLAGVREKSRWTLLRISTLVDEVKSKDDELNAIVVAFKPKMDEPTRTRIENAFFELHGSDTDFLYWDRLLTMSPDVLTLFLVLAMGVLGSSLQVTQSSFTKGTGVTIGGYFLRLSVGALTALIIFIVAKAGVPVIADPARLGGDGSINPYFVSFLAIVSGLLSENAIANIQAQGTRIFGQAATDGPPRWAHRDLTDDLKNQNVDLKTLASSFGEPEQKVEAALRGKEPLTSAQQNMLALLLRADPREFLTDISPTPP
jgi:hypothetical protein